MVKFEEVLFWIFVILSVGLFLWFIFGNSPALEQSLLALLIGFVIKLHGDIKELKGRFDMFADKKGSRKKK